MQVLWQFMVEGLSQPKPPPDVLTAESSLGK